MISDSILCLLVLPSFLAVIAIFHFHLQSLNQSLYRLQVLVTRTSLFLPIYSLLIYISYLVPAAYDGIQVPIAMSESYFFLCFFVLIVENLGGPLAAVKIISVASRPIFCPCCCPTNYGDFYIRVRNNLMGVFITRNLVVIAQAIASYFTSKIAKVITVLLALISFVLVVRGFMSLAMFYENILSISGNINGLYKLMLIKISVVLIVLQGLIFQILEVLDSVKTKSSDDFSRDEMLTRSFCLIVLIEYVVVSFFLYLAFAKVVVKNDAIASKIDVEVAAPAPTVTSSASNVSCCAFLCDVLSFSDIIPTISTNVEDMKRSLLT